MGKRKTEVLMHSNLVKYLICRIKCCSHLDVETLLVTNNSLDIDSAGIGIGL